jgi:hypothetical protein
MELEVFSCHDVTSNEIGAEGEILGGSTGHTSGTVAEVAILRLIVLCC